MTKTIEDLLDQAGVPYNDDNGVELDDRLRVSVLISERDDLLALIEDVAPFVGWEAQVPDLKDRIAVVLGEKPEVPR
jgi:hypothetical protein